MGSLTGAVASKKVTEAYKGSLRLVGNQSKSAKAEGSLTAEVQFEQGGNTVLVIRRCCVEGPSFNG